MAELRDYIAWHRAYDDPESGLSWRLRTVQDWLRRALDEGEGPRRSPRSIVSVCAGEGRDVIGVLSDRGVADQTTATLVELDPRIADTARAAAVTAGLTTVEVRQTDAGHTDAYAGLPPADIVLLVGIFGNISTDDIRRTIAWSPQLCAPGATLLWSRGRDRGDLNAQIRAWFTEAGFAELDYVELDRHPRPALGAVRYVGEPVGETIDGRLFTFVH
jgi:hypothetical protein